MSKPVGLKAVGTSKRKIEVGDAGADELALTDMKKVRRNVKKEQGDPTTSTADNVNPEEAEAERNDRADSFPPTTTQSAVMPKEMYNFCKSILEMEDAGNANLSRLKGNAKFSQLLRNNPLFDDSVDVSTFQHSFAQFYRFATLLSEVSLTKALHTVMEYVQNEQMVFRHPNYPKRPATAFTRFAQSTGLGPFKSNEKMCADYKNDKDPRVVKAKQEHGQDRERYLTKLREFLNSHTDELFEAQITHLQKEIKKTEKSIEQKEPQRRNRKSNGGIKLSKKQLPSAFDLYKQSKGQKYDHLSPEEREAKMRRHFDKLTAEQREIYESIANSLQ